MKAVTSGRAVKPLEQGVGTVADTVVGVEFMFVGGSILELTRECMDRTGKAFDEVLLEALESYLEELRR